MSLDCSIKNLLIADFDKLWHCTHRGNTVEIVTPYLMPDSTFFTLFFTQREDRLIACDGGRIWELIRDTIGGSYDDALGELRALAEQNQISEGENEGEPVFFKECLDQKLLSSIAFDVGNFATMATNVLSAAYLDEPEEKETRFATETRNYLNQIIDIKDSDPKPRHLFFNAPVPGVPNVKFSAVVSAASRMSIVSCVNGTSFNDFRKNTLDAAFNLKLAWRSNARTQLDKTVPILNDRARGYDPDKLADRIKELTDQAKMEPILWSQKEKLRHLLAA